ncbi:DUF5694 domain-containing protein [Luteimonas sp. 22616]|uniref:DUF5694 domain-containing protein n=1 Tax=Luteimonas sp. 22616 TaxID=3453951 RepID=UPI003F824F63
MRMHALAPMLLSLCLSAGHASRAAEPLLSLDPPSPKPQLLVVGLYHMDNPGRDVVNLDADDVLSPQRQREIEAVARALAAFEPTRIAIESPRAKQHELDRRYARYRAGDYSLDRSEDDQLGLRIAAMRELPRIDAVDWNEMPPVTGIEVIDYEAGAQRLGQQAFLAALRARLKVRAAVDQRHLEQGSIADMLRWLNDPQRLRDSNAAYFDYARIADDDDYPGANWLQFWYGRNLKIFSNLTRIAGPGERVLVIYGAGHAPLLRQFAQQSGYFEVVDPLRYLDAAAPAPQPAAP